jgi:hypothetical protein
MSVVRFVLVLTPNTILPPPVFGILTSELDPTERYGQPAPGAGA